MLSIAVQAFSTETARLNQTSDWLKAKCSQLLVNNSRLIFYLLRNLKMFSHARNVFLY